MKGWIRKTCVGCVVALALGAPEAYADGGRITFQGAVVVPTCSAPDEGVRPVNRSGGCGVASDQLVPHASFYRQDVVPLEHALAQQDRLLNYFGGYAGMVDTGLTTRVYD